MKTCTKCGECKPLEDFTRRLDRPSGYASQCRRCVGLLTKDYWARNPEKLALKKHSHYLRHADHVKAKTRAREAEIPAEQMRAYRRGMLAQHRREIRDWYVADLLTAEGSSISRTEIPLPLIEAKRQFLKVKRLINERKTQ